MDLIKIDHFCSDVYPHKCDSYPKHRILKIQQKRTNNSAKELVKSHQRRYINGKYASEKMFSILCQKEIST